MELAETLAEACKPGADIVLSGLLDIQAENLSTHYQQWFNMAPSTQREGWMRLSGQRH